MKLDLVPLKEASRRTGLDTEDIEYAEQAGLISEGREAEGYYSSAQLRTLDGIAKLRDLGLTLDEIRDMNLSEDRLRALAVEKECTEVIEVAEGPSICKTGEVSAAPVERHAAAVQREAAYGIKVWVDMPFEDALSAVRDELAREGFVVMTEIDVRKLLREKLGTDSPHHTVLGVLSPEMTRQALDLDPDIGLLLPWNLVIYEQAGGSIIEAVDTIALLSIADSSELQDLARSAKQKLQDVIDRVASRSA